MKGTGGARVCVRACPSRLSRSPHSLFFPNQLIYTTFILSVAQGARLCVVLCLHMTLSALECVGDDVLRAAD